MKIIENQEISKKSVYIHIPFCKSICSYCDFCKFYYNKDWINKYLKELRNEIETKYKGEIIKTLYIGGGTPSSLDIYELQELFDIIKIFKLSKNVEFTFECNIETLTQDKLKLLKNNNVNRLSIGVQTFNEKYLKFLNRNHTSKEVLEKITLAKNIGFDNINIDLIYAIPGETIEEIDKDLDLFLDLDITHISTYSLMIEPNTKLYIEKTESIDEDIDYKMYEYICKKLKSYGYIHYEISNFSKKGYESRHNLTYWNNLEYYGFGIGSSGYIDNIRYDNTKNLNKYLSGNYVSESRFISEHEKLQNEFILGFRKINGIDKNDFYNKYGFDIKDIDIIKKLLKEEKLLENKKNIYINPKYIYVSNDILIEFID